MTYGRVLAAALGKPLISVNHLEGHIHAVFLEAHLAGSHAAAARSLFWWSPAATQFSTKSPHKPRRDLQDAPNTDASQFRYRRLGGTRDDAAGEAYDKVAKLSALGYPGGPILDALASAVPSKQREIRAHPTSKRSRRLQK